MKKILSFFALLLFACTLMAQTTTLTFTGRDANNHFIPLNRVVITNLTKGWQETIYYPDTILVMSSTGIEDYGKMDNFSLSQNYPNPFDGASDFSLCLPKEGSVAIEVYDLNGKRITFYNSTLAAGCHVFRVLLSTAQSYFLTARSGNDQASIKMVNTGNAGSNALLYIGEGNMQPLSVTLNNDTKGESTQPFTFGDMMEYVGFAIINGQECESQRISQQQGSSQSFILQFSAIQAMLPTVTTTAVSNITQNSATTGGNVTSDGGANVIVRGVCWSANQNPTTADSHTTDGSGIGSFTSSLTGLTLGITYYVRAYATNSVGTAYGEQQSFTTTDLHLPIVVTSAVTDITQTTATCGGNVTSDGGTTVTARGVCWSTNQNPTTADSHTTDGSGIGSFTSSITGLTMGTTYYVRAYATNSVGTAYGEQQSFTTTVHLLPTVVTSAVTNITQSTATCGGNVSNDGGATVTARGVCWSTSQNSTISDSHTSDGSGTGSFTSSITGLVQGTTYYVRAYATNSVGTAYGNEVSFTTTAYYLPTVTTSDITDITCTTATCGGNVTDDGGYSVLARGICWSTQPNPIFNDNHTSDGSGTGSFSSNITGLSVGTTYYVRAYAVSSVGTAYGNEVSFTTTAYYLPTVTTSVVTNVGPTTATCGGNVTDNDDGNAMVTARGVCWSTSQNPTISDSHTTDGTGAGSFSSNLTGLTASTTYCVRAYAINSVGVAYGNVETFTTSAAFICGTSTLTDVDSNVYNTVQIGNQCWMRENLRTTKYADGTNISLGSSTSTTTAYRYYPNNTSSNVSTYGYLYNWKAVMHNSSYSSNNPSGVQGICPNGWHVPSSAEWMQLINFVNSQNQYVCGNSNYYIAKAIASTIGWNVSTNLCDVGNNPSENNATGFSAVPSSFFDGNYYSLGLNSSFWSSTKDNSINTPTRWYLSFDGKSLNDSSLGKICGLSVRCLKD